MSILMVALREAANLMVEGNDEDAIDRLNYAVTSAMLTVMAIVVGWKQFGSHPIDCIMPDQMPGKGTRQYVEMYCFTQDTYVVKQDQDIPLLEQDKKRISYYQWVPFFLIFQAMVFQLPHMFWQVTSTQSGIKVRDVITTANKQDMINQDTRQATIIKISNHLKSNLDYHHRRIRKNLVPHSWILPLNLPYQSFYVSLMYALTKLLYLINSLVALYFLNNMMLGKDRMDLGKWITFYRAVTAPRQWWNAGFFPRTTICDVEIRTMASLHQYSLECVLPINMLNEKVFSLLWFHYAILTIINLVSGIKAIFTTFSRNSRYLFILRHLQLSDVTCDEIESMSEIERFVFKHLQVDGVFVTRAISKHAGVLLATEMIAQLWKDYYESENVRQLEKNVIEAWRKKTDDAKMQWLMDTYHEMSDAASDHGTLPVSTLYRLASTIQRPQMSRTYSRAISTSPPEPYDPSTMEGSLYLDDIGDKYHQKSLTPVNIGLQTSRAEYTRPQAGTSKPSPTYRSSETGRYDDRLRPPYVIPVPDSFTNLTSLRRKYGRDCELSPDETKSTSSSSRSSSTHSSGSPVRRNRRRAEEVTCNVEMTKPSNITLV